MQGSICIPLGIFLEAYEAKRRRFTAKLLISRPYIIYTSDVWPVKSNTDQIAAWTSEGDLYSPSPEFRVGRSTDSKTYSYT